MDQSKLESLMREKLSEVPKGVVCAQHETDYCAFFNFLEFDADLASFADGTKGIRQFAENAGWLFHSDNVAIPCERYTAIRFDERGNLHDDNRPAFIYPDGYAYYAVHGVKIPGWVIENPELITTAKISAERNQEVKRVMMTRYGWHRYVKDINADLIHGLYMFSADTTIIVSDPDDTENCYVYDIGVVDTITESLYNAIYTDVTGIDKMSWEKAKLKFDLGKPKDLIELYRWNDRELGYEVQIVRVMNGTLEEDNSRKEYGIGVTLDHKNALDAIRSSYKNIEGESLSRKEYLAMVRT